jgi:hypothetical protein
MLALTMLLVQVSLTGMAGVLGGTDATVLEWRERAAQQVQESNEHRLRELPGTQGQRDERWHGIDRQHSRQADTAGERPDLAEEGRPWIGIGFAPEVRLILATVVGPRTDQTARLLIQWIAGGGSGVPCFVSDGFSCDLAALIESD